IARRQPWIKRPERQSDLYPRRPASVRTSLKLHPLRRDVQAQIDVRSGRLLPHERRGQPYFQIAAAQRRYQRMTQRIAPRRRPNLPVESTARAYLELLIAHPNLDPMLVPVSLARFPADEVVP